MKSFFVRNDKVYINVLDNEVDCKDKPTLLVIGGIWESAERALPLLSGISSHVVALSFRGRGLSSTPNTGYDLSDHISDIEAVVNHYGLKAYCVLGFSRGGAYALEWTLRDQDNMNGLIIVDQPPRHEALDAEKSNLWSTLIYRGIPVTNFIRHSAVEGLAREAKEIDFTSKLGLIQIPVTIFVGRGSDTNIPSDISEETLRKYKTQIAHCKVVEFGQSGHMIPDEQREKYIEQVNQFIRNCCD
jgi:pimeloyl-ACP methyl ester carboxylesterase